MSQENIEPPAIAASAGPTCWASGPLNLNTYLRFKMNPRGVELVREYFRELGFPNCLFSVDVAGVECRQQFHEVFRIFGGGNMRDDMDGSPIYDLVVEPMD